jgi:hypothetical protein
MFAKAADYLKQSRQRAQEGHLPVYRQLAEMAVLELGYSIGPGFYHAARFWRLDMPFRSKTRYRTGKRYLKAVAAINNPAYYKLSQHKVAEKALLMLFAIPTTEFFGFFHPHSGRTGDGRPLTNDEEFLALLQRRTIAAAAIKMPEGSCGTGFDIIDIDAENQGQIFSRVLQQRMPVAEYLALKHHESVDQGVVVEAVIDQHPAMAELNASSVNSLRMWVRQSRTGVKVKSVLLKIGHPQNLTDNSPTGGLVVPADVPAGVLGEPIFLPPPAGETAGDHFDCRRLEGFKIPFWQETLELAKRSLRVFPHLNFAGMDVAITADGPLIIELNVEPDAVHATRVDIPTLNLLSGE